MEKKEDQDKSWWEKLGFDQDDKTQPKQTETAHKDAKESSKSPVRRTEIDIDIEIEKVTAARTEKQAPPVVQ